LLVDVLKISGFINELKLGILKEINGFNESKKSVIEPKDYLKTD